MTREERLERRLSRLYDKIAAYGDGGSYDGTRRYGGSNPYRYCGACSRSDVEVSYAGHYKGCAIAGFEKEIEHYRKLLREENDRTNSIQS